jgi:hypothetical protein
MGMGMMPWRKIGFMLRVVGEMEVLMVVRMVLEVLFLAVLVLALLPAGMGPVVMRAWFGLVPGCHGKSCWAPEDMRLAVTGGEVRPGRKVHTKERVFGEYPTSCRGRAGSREKRLFLLFLCHLPDLVVDMGTVLHVMPLVVAHSQKEPA